MANNTTLAGVRLQGGGVVATGAANFTVQDCTVANTTGDGLAVTQPSGTVNLRNNRWLSNGGRGMALQFNSGLSNLVLSDNTIANSTTDGLFANVTGTANVTWTETRSTIQNAGTNPFGNGWNVFTRNTGALNASLSQCASDGATRFGLEYQSFDTSNCTLVFDRGVIRNGASRGYVLGANGGSTLKSRVSNTQTNQNLAGFGFEAGNDTTALMCLRVVNVTSDIYRLGNNSPGAPFNIENFANFSSENGGTVNILVGNINSVAIGSCGIP